MIGQLAARDDGVVGNAYYGWGMIPKGMFQFGAGGINGVGAQCGNFISSEAVLKQIGAPAALMDYFLRWFENNYLPSNAAYLDYASGTWTPGGTATGGWGTASNQLTPPLNNAPRIKMKTTTCHGGLTKWKVAASSWITAKGADSVKDRCSKTSYDSVYMLATLINNWKAGTLPTAIADPVPAGCKTSACHGSNPPTGVQGYINCIPCHDGTEAITPGHGL